MLGLLGMRHRLALCRLAGLRRLRDGRLSHRLLLVLYGLLQIWIRRLRCVRRRWYAGNRWRWCLAGLLRLVEVK
jgi:hypothetical protein